MARTPQEIIDAIDDYHYACSIGAKVKSYEIGGKDLENWSPKELEGIRAANVIRLSRSQASGRGRGMKTRTRFER